MRETSSKERILAALDHQEPDYAPCCFSAYSGLRNRCRDEAEYIQKLLAMGVDPVASIPDIEIAFHNEVVVREWKEIPRHGKNEYGVYPILHCEYATPAGTLNRRVIQTEDWPDGDHIPFISDHVIPRATKHLITTVNDLDALEYILTPPRAEAIESVRRSAAQAKALAEKFRLPVVAGTGMHADLACWLSGIEPLIYACIDTPDYVLRYLDIIEAWNRTRMEIVLAEKPDVYIRRGWYENADYWSPDIYRTYLLPALRRDAEQVHASGARLGYIMSCSSMPLIETLIEAGVDVLLGIDPAQDRMMDFDLLKSKTKGKLAIWGGVCGYLTVECGDEEDIRREVRNAVSAFGHGGGFILAPVTNVRADTERSRRNVDCMIDEWKGVR